MQWYVYHLIDTRIGEPFYVGKGKGRRAQQHVPRALRWKSKGRPSGKGNNAKLWNKILSVLDNGFEVRSDIVKIFAFEKDALAFEVDEIQRFGVRNLCNLTLGGEGEQRTKESLNKLSSSLQKFWESERGIEVKKRFSEERAGSGNPHWGVVEDEEHKNARMKNLLATPRWNKGLKGDSRSRGFPKGEPTWNSKTCKLINDDGRVFEARSLSELSRVSGVSQSTISRLQAKFFEKSRAGWRLVINARANEQS